MAGEWIKVENVTPDKPEIGQMAESLGIELDAVLGKLIRLWIWADEQTYDGNAGTVTKTLLDRITGVTGFAQAMITSGWLAEKDGTLMFPRFDRHNGKTAKGRALTSIRVRSYRTKKRNAGTVTSSSLLSSLISSSSLEVPEGFLLKDFESPLLEWIDYRLKGKHRYKDWGRSLSLLLKQFRRPEDFRAAVQHSIAQGYQGCFPPSQRKADERQKDLGRYRTTQPLPDRHDRPPAEDTSRRPGDPL